MDLRELEVAWNNYLEERYDTYLDISELYGGDDVDYQEFYDGFSYDKLDELLFSSDDLSEGYRDLLDYPPIVHDDIIAYNTIIYDSQYCFWEGDSMTNIRATNYLLQRMLWFIDYDL